MFRIGDVQVRKLHSIGFEGDRLEVVGVARFTPTVTEALLLVSYSSLVALVGLALFSIPLKFQFLWNQHSDFRVPIRAAGDSDFKYLFTLFDSDSDGTITANELDGVMRWLNDVEPSESEIWRGRISSAITDADDESSDTSDVKMLGISGGVARAKETRRRRSPLQKVKNIGTGMIGSVDAAGQRWSFRPVCENTRIRLPDASRGSPEGTTRRSEIRHNNHGKEDQRPSILKTWFSAASMAGIDEITSRLNARTILYDNSFL
ncbi:hypothetical protein Tcan_03718 [Toxocara canis]|uniref:EF-hand domain-containing protein n=1 Tax=Toxocara canis TaxID=6265 RepID=A0A0B2VGL0_TOXCA|nr:hypothetical protein Tcan_03718 [Toxocara canis]